MVIAHRTCPPYAPENSLEGVRVAVEQGADGIEIDLRSSLDLQPYLMHDNTMARTTGFPLPIEATPSFIVRQTRLRVGSDESPPASRSSSMPYRPTSSSPSTSRRHGPHSR